MWTAHLLSGIRTRSFQSATASNIVKEEVLILEQEAVNWKPPLEHCHHHPAKKVRLLHIVSPLEQHPSLISWVAWVYVQVSEWRRKEERNREEGNERRQKCVFSCQHLLEILNSVLKWSKKHEFKIWAVKRQVPAKNTRMERKLAIVYKSYQFRNQLCGYRQTGWEK